MSRAIACVLVTACVTIGGLTAQTPGAAEKFTLPIPTHLAPGAVIRMVQTTDISTSFRIGERDVHTGQKITMDMTQRAEKPLADGSSVLEATIDRVRQETSGNFGPSTSYDSAAPIDPDADNAKSPQAMAAKIFGLMVGWKIRVGISPTGELKSLTGLDDLTEKLKGVDPIVATATRQAMGKMITDDGLRSMVGMAATQSPKAPVTVGESWPVTMSMNEGPVPIKLAGSIKLASVTADGIDTQGTLEVMQATDAAAESKPAKPSIPGVKDIHVKSGRETVRSVISRKDGFPIEMTVDGTIEMDMTMMGMPGAPAAAPMPMTVHVVMTNKRVDGVATPATTSRPAPK